MHLGGGGETVVGCPWTSLALAKSVTVYKQRDLKLFVTIENQGFEVFSKLISISLVIKAVSLQRRCSRSNQADCASILFSNLEIHNNDTWLVKIQIWERCPASKITFLSPAPKRRARVKPSSPTPPDRLDPLLIDSDNVQTIYRIGFLADVSARAPIRYSLNERTATARDWNKRSHTSNIVKKRLVHEIPVLTPKYLLQTQWFLFLAPTYSLPLRIEYLFTIHKDRRGAARLGFKRGATASASLRHRNRVEITVLVCELNPYLVWFSCRRKSYSV